MEHKIGEFWSWISFGLSNVTKVVKELDNLGVAKFNMIRKFKS